MKWYPAMLFTALGASFRVRASEVVSSSNPLEAILVQTVPALLATSAGRHHLERKDLDDGVRMLRVIRERSDDAVRSRGLRVRCRQIARIRMPPKSITRSPTLNSPSSTWSVRKTSRVFGVAARHIGLAGCSVEGMPTTGIAPAFASVTSAFSISPHSIRTTPA
jgi:hypothetical protein